MLAPGFLGACRRSRQEGRCCSNREANRVLTSQGEGERDFNLRWGMCRRLEGQGNKASGEMGSSQGTRRAGGDELLSLYRGDAE